MSFSFENKVALVTGAASGIGLATAQAFARAGAAVALADIDGGAAQAAAQALIAAGHRAIGIRCDVADVGQVQAMVKETVATFGRLDAAFNNAGIQNLLAETADATVEDYDRVMSVNLRGVWACMKFELEHMRRQGGGTIRHRDRHRVSSYRPAARAAARSGDLLQADSRAWRCKPGTGCCERTATGRSGMARFCCCVKTRP